MQRRILSLLTTLLLTSIAPASIAHADDWASFRGPNADGISVERAVFPAQGDFRLDIAWQIEIGSGYSGIAVADGRLVTVSAEGDRHHLTAYDIENGNALWHFDLAEIYKGHDGSHDGPIATPLIADGRVFALDPRGRLVAVSAKSGELIWETNLAEDHEIAKPHYGFGGSPILEDGVLILGFGEGKTVAGLDPATGEVRWLAGEDGFSYQTPVPAVLNGRRQVVVASDKEVFGLTPQNGEILWQYRHDGGGGRGAGSLTPVMAGEGRLLLGHQDDASMLLGVDAEGAAAPVWDGRTLRNSYSIAVHHKGRLFGYNSRILTCADAATGEALWRSRHPGDGFLLIADERLVIATKTGSVHVAELSSEGYKELAGVEVFDEHLWTAPAFSGGSIYVRSLGGLARLDIRDGDAVKDRVAQAGNSVFASFLANLEATREEYREPLIDKFMAQQKAFPIVEAGSAPGRGLAHFVYRGDARDVALGGDMFGARREEPMQRASGTTLLYRTVELENDARVNYLFIENFADQVRDPLNPRQTTTTFMREDMEMSFGSDELPMSWIAMPDWQEPAHLTPVPAEHPRGVLVEHEIEAKSLGDDKKAMLTVYLPPGFDDSGETLYPVAYHHNGKTGLERGRIADSLDHLIGKSVAPVIVAFIDMPARGPEASRAFLLDVIPFLDAEYPLRPEREARANLGNAFPAATAFLVTLAHSDKFGLVGMQSPYLFTQLAQAVKGSIDGAEGEDLKIYLDWGKYDLRNPHEAWDMGQAARDFAAQLGEKNLSYAGGEANDGTGWSSWRLRTNRVFEALFPLRP